VMSGERVDRTRNADCHPERSEGWRRAAFAIACLSVALTCAPASAGDAEGPASRPVPSNGPPVTVLDLAARTTSGRLMQIDLPGTIQVDAGGKVLETAAGQAIWLGFELWPQAEPQVVQWFCDPPVPIRDKPEPAVQVRLVLRGGQVLFGALREPLKPDSLTIQHRLLGSMDLPFDQISEIRLESDPAAAHRAIASTTGAFDVLWLANGDRVEGILRSMGADQLTVELASGQHVRMPTRAVRLIQLAAVSSPATATDSRPAPVLAWLRLRDGQRIAASRIGWDPAHLAVTFAFQGRPIVLPAEQIAGIEPVTTKWQWLTDLPPAGYEHKPLLAPFLKWRIDLTAAGTPVWCNGSPVPRGLGMPAGSTIRFDLGGAYSRLLVWPILDDSSGPAGSCTARILVDGKPQWEGTVKSFARSAGVIVDLADKRELVLHVEPADTGDVLTRFVWAWPALVR
jgi:hypothetical protein